MDVISRAKEVQSGLFPNEGWLQRTCLPTTHWVCGYGGVYNSLYFLTPYRPARLMTSLRKQNAEGNHEVKQYPIIDLHS